MTAGAPEPEAIELPVALGSRVLVVSDLLLSQEASPSSLALAGELSLTLEHWEGAGSIIVAGNLFCEDTPTPELMAKALDAHPSLVKALEQFTATQGRRVIVLPGWRDPEASSAIAQYSRLANLETASEVLMVLQTGAGEQRVEVKAGQHNEGLDPGERGGFSSERPWLVGMERLEQAEQSRRFTSSRLLYRRLARFIWLPPFLAIITALAVRISWVSAGLEKIIPGKRGLISRAQHAQWENLAIVTVALVIGSELLLGLAVWLWSRRLFSQSEATNAGMASDAPAQVLSVNESSALDYAVARLSDGISGVIVGGSLRAELTHLSGGFFASPGGTTEIVREHHGNLGLPPVFLHHRQASSLEVETGASLHVRLVVADIDLPLSTVTERIVTGYAAVKGRKAAADLHPAMVASWPTGNSWPPAPDIARERLHARRIRRITASALFATGLIDILLAASPPLRHRLHVVSAYLPLGASQTAGALVAVSGIALTMLARGVLRGQRRPWKVAVGLLAVTLGLHLAHEVSITGSFTTAVVLMLLLVEQRYFRAETEQGSLATALSTLFIGGIVAVGAAFIGIQISDLSNHQLPAWPLVLAACAERLAGIDSIALPEHIDDFVYPILFTTGIALLVTALFQATRPVVARRLNVAKRSSERKAAEHRARDIVRRHGYGTLDYFALRDDKQWFFWRDSLVAYAVYGGMCLVSPDPIGPLTERDQVWAAFRSFADTHGWGVAIMAAAEEWLPIYREAGMRHLYLGDEAVVNVREFSLQGGKMKGLRQACSRIERAGYSVETLDPNDVPRERIPALAELLDLKRRGEAERGFSMMLGRLFDPRDKGLLLTIVTGPDGQPAAMCQFVPSPAIRGWSLDLMRRDPAEHPNGLLDYALCATIDHLREAGDHGLSLNFSAMRSVLDGERGDSLAIRIERWGLQRLSGVLPIETLWKFNAKYRPSWLPRYICFDSAENFLPTVVQILRAEAITEIPVIGKLFRQSDDRLSASVIPADLLAELETIELSSPSPVDTAQLPQV